MGCDIHIEVLLKKSGDVWRVAPPPLWGQSDYPAPFTAISYSWPEGRDYVVFGKLADGVRGYSGDIPPRGIPDWVQTNSDGDWVAEGEIHGQYDTAKIRLDLGDHTRSWLSMEEYFSIRWDPEEWPLIHLSPLLSRLCEIFGKENLFLVFGFDS